MSGTQTFLATSFPLIPFDVSLSVEGPRSPAGILEICLFYATLNTIQPGLGTAWLNTYPPVVQNMISSYVQNTVQSTPAFQAAANLVVQDIGNLSALTLQGLALSLVDASDSENMPLEMTDVASLLAQSLDTISNTPNDSIPDAMTPAGGSTSTVEYPTTVPNANYVSSIITNYFGPNGAGGIANVVVNYVSGASAITIYNADGSMATTNYSDANGAGTPVSETVQGDAFIATVTPTPGASAGTLTYTSGGELIIIQGGHVGQDAGVLTAQISIAGLPSNYQGPAPSFSLSALGESYTSAANTVAQNIVIITDGKVVGWTFVLEGPPGGINTTSLPGNNPLDAANINGVLAGNQTAGTWEQPAAATVTIDNDGTLDLDTLIGDFGSTPQNLSAQGDGTLASTQGQNVSMSDLTLGIDNTWSITGATAAFDPLTVQGLVTGYGTIDAGGVTNTGTIAASGGTLALNAPVSGTGTLTIGSGADLALGGIVAGGQTLYFDGTGTTLTLGQGAGFGGTIDGWAVGDTIAVAGTVQSAVFNTLSEELAITAASDGAAPTYTLQFAGGPLNQSAFTVENGVVADTVACFLAGTRIATRRGDVPVEHLGIGDRVPTQFAGAAAVRWLGHRRVDCHRHPRPRDVWPVRVRAGAFGDQRPHRDLFLSPDHAVFIDGVLIPVRYLINGATIAQEERDDVTYWHVELDRHDVILAEGMPCESFLDTGNRGAFANGGAAVQLHPDFTPRVWDADACAPLALRGPQLAAVKQRLRDRAKALGHALAGDRPQRFGGRPRACHRN